MINASIQITLVVLPILLSIHFANSSKNKQIFKQRTRGKKVLKGKLVGGWAIMLTLFFSYTFFQNLTPEMQNFLSIPKLFFPFFLLGLIDDLNGMRAERKLFYQAAILVFFLSGVETNLLNIFLLLVFGLIVINGFNFIDGINGLLPAVSFVLFSQLEGGMLIATIMLGMLYVSRKHKKVYLGDSGSLLLGALAFSGLFVGFENPSTLISNLKPISLFFLLPIADVLWAVLRRSKFGDGEKKTLKGFFKKISTPDEKHIHHLLKSRYGEHATIVICMLLTWVATEFAFMYSTAL